eukprot:178184_1
MRVNLSVAIEPMSCKYRWSNRLQGYALSSFFVGYFIGNIPSGLLSEKYGAKLIYGGGLFITSILTLLLPIIISHDTLLENKINCKCDESIANEWAFINGHYRQLGDIKDIIFDSICEYDADFYLLCITRMVTGLFESVAFPSSYFLLNNWTIPSERSRFVSLNAAGATLGTCITLFLCPMLIESTWFGWKYTFYTFAIMSFIFLLFWYYFLFDSPVNDPYIKSAELAKLSVVNKHHSEAQLLLNEATVSKTVQLKNSAVSWHTLLTHPVAWSLYMAHFCSNWTNYFMLTMLPTFINKELKYDLSSSAFVVILPSMMRTIMSIASSFWVDNLIQNGYDKWNVRRIAQIVSTVVPGAILVLCGYVSYAPLSVLFVSISTGLSGIATCGFMSCFVEVSPTMSNVIYGISNCLATLPGVIAPIFSGYILGDSPGIQQWRILFYVAFGMHIIGIIGFCYLGTSKRVAALNKT